MVFFNYALRKLNAKIVYYGPGLCGKTTNLQWIHDHFEGGKKGNMLSLATEGDRTIFFDLLPLDIGTIRGMDVTLQLYTVPGQVHYNSTRQLVLRGADGVVFVADSQRAMLGSNLDSWKNLKENLLLQGIELRSFPHVLQFNKRDLADILSVERLDEELNEYSAPIFEAVAIEGIGVQETLEGIVKLVMRSLRERYEAEFAHPGAPGGLAQPQAPAAPPAPPVAAGPQPPSWPVPAAPAAAPPAEGDRETSTAPVDYGREPEAETHPGVAGLSLSGGEAEEEEKEPTLVIEPEDSGLPVPDVGELALEDGALDTADLVEEPSPLVMELSPAAEEDGPEIPGGEAELRIPEEPVASPELEVGDEAQAAPPEVVPPPEPEPGPAAVPYDGAEAASATAQAAAEPPVEKPAEEEAGPPSDSGADHEAPAMGPAREEEPSTVEAEAEVEEPATTPFPAGERASGEEPSHEPAPALEDATPFGGSTGEEAAGVGEAAAGIEVSWGGEVAAAPPEVPEPASGTPGAGQGSGEPVEEPAPAEPFDLPGGETTPPPVRDEDLFTMGEEDGPREAVEEAAAPEGRAGGEEGLTSVEPVAAGEPTAFESAVEPEGRTVMEDEPLGAAPAVPEVTAAPPDAVPSEGPAGPERPPQEPVAVWEGDPFELPGGAAEAAEPRVLAPVEARAVAGEEGRNQLRLRLEGKGALAEYGQVRELDIVVPVPGDWIGGQKVTLQFRLTLVPEGEEGE